MFTLSIPFIMFHLTYYDLNCLPNKKGKDEERKPFLFTFREEERRGLRWWYTAKLKKSVTLFGSVAIWVTDVSLALLCTSQETKVGIQGFRKDDLNLVGRLSDGGEGCGYLKSSANCEIQGDVWVRNENSITGSCSSSRKTCYVFEKSQVFVRRVRSYKRAMEESWDAGIERGIEKKQSFLSRQRNRRRVFVWNKKQQLLDIPCIKLLEEGVRKRE